jgi:hypothetical protein
MLAGSVDPVEFDMLKARVEILEKYLLGIGPLEPKCAPALSEVVTEAASLYTTGPITSRFEG